VSAERNVPVDEATPAEAMANGRMAGRIEAYNEVLRFAVELKMGLGPLEDPRSLRQVITHCADQIRAVQGDQYIGSIQTEL
jgi:hypothetical protein